MINFFLAGAWTFIWQWGLSIGLIICLLGGAYFAPITQVRIHLLWAAFGVCLFLAGHHMGAKASDARTAKRAVLIDMTVDKAVDRAGSRQTKDPWDKPEH